MWYREVIGHNRCPIVDTWWQTETGHIMLSPIPGAIAAKPGSATRPFPGRCSRGRHIWTANLSPKARAVFWF